MNASSNDSAEFASVCDDLAALRTDVGALIAHLEEGARDAARGAGNQLGGGVRDLSHGVADSGRKSARAMGAWVEERPLLAFSIAIGIGFVGARALLR
ncbi:MAG: hypothetical protein KGM15_01400 [Pseudomonadota bacterium]|nr:hypothetical protein [Pseudomonadota bacterium]